MAVVLLDTSVASLLLPDRAHRPELAFYRPHIIGNTPALSFQSIAELWKLAEKRRWASQRRDILDGFLRSFVVTPYDYELARVWARVCVEAERMGRRLEVGDAWIAATAVHRRIALLVHDRDFVNLPISV